MADECDMQVDNAPAEKITSESFTFAQPNIVSSPERVVDFGKVTEYSVPNDGKSTFTFAKPASIPLVPNQNEGAFDHEDWKSEKQYKPKIFRNTFKPPVSVFTQALRETTGFELSKKQSRLQGGKENIEYSITCINVPKSLLTKVAAKEYFVKYGNISKITLRPRKQTITIFYTTAEAANIAYQNSGEYLGQKFDVYWTNSEMLPKSPVKKKESSKTTVRHFLTGTDEEVQAELDAMSGLEYRLHGEHKVGAPPVLRKPRIPIAKEAQKYEKATKLEKQPVKVEKYEAESQIQNIVPSATIEELQNTIRQMASTAEDKYRILEARDRLIRFKQIKPHTLATAKSTKGTCPDMCPEKERLMRESQRQVAAYELMEGAEYKINHMIAIKQYSRSSADQEEPLAHELRPVESLKMTMSYLLHEIANLCDEEGTNLAEWFHFLWDRTRGIRKDITQQELCCTDSVELVEQCARFHIVCSERLCAEEPSVFDKKINTENLTKCLQSLKYMYQDLRVKGISCKNEPEFRAYIILLNLNNGNFMWEVQKLPITLQKSPEVRFAIEVYSSLQSNNFSKFFKLVRSTTYLNACILLRYFNQVRVKALSVMVKAYCRTTSTPFPLYELIDILGFEDENEAIYFCEQVGLNTSSDDMSIMLNRQNFSSPISSIDQGRAINIVESKRTGMLLSIGECITGGMLPEQTYKNHKPHESFDSSGYLKTKSINAEDQSGNNISDISDPYEFKDDHHDDRHKPSRNFKSQVSTKHSTLNDTGASPLTRQIDVSTKKPVGRFTGQSTNKQQNIFPYKPNTNTTVFAKPEEPGPFGTKHPPNTSEDHASQPHNKFDLATENEGPFSSKSTVFGTKTNETSRFNSPFATSTISTAGKGSSIFSKSNLTSSTHPMKTTEQETSTTFGAGTITNIFSKPTLGNIFAKSTPVATAFSRNHSNAQASEKIKEGSDSISSKNILKTSDPKSPVKKQLKIHSEISQTKLEVEKRLQAEKIKLQKIEREKKLKAAEAEASLILKALEDDVIKDMCSSLVRKEFNKILMINKLSKKIMEDMVNQIVLESCEDILNEIYIQQRLLEISQKIKRRLIMKYYMTWRQCASKKRREREALDNTPVWLQKRSVEECANLLYRPDQHLVIESMRRKKIKREVEKPKRQMEPIEVIIHNGVKENAKYLDIEAVPNTFWKMVISWPDLEKRFLLWKHKKIMSEYLCPDDFTTEPIIKTYRPNSYETLNLCIRQAEGLISDHKLIGIDALLFIIDTSEDAKSVIRRLTKTVLSRNKLMPIPLYFVALGNEHWIFENSRLKAHLEKLIESDYVSQYTVHLENTINENVILELIQNATRWLSKNKSPAVPLEMDYLSEVLDGCLTEELWLKIQGHSPFNEHLASVLNDPNFIINFHNEAVTHLRDIFLDSESLSYTDFAPELKKCLNTKYELPCSYEYFNDAWKKEGNREELESALDKLKLPRWNFDWPIMDMWELRNSISYYCQEALPESNYDTVPYTILSNLFLTANDSDIPSFVNVILRIVKEKISLIRCHLKVVYNRNHMKHFRTLPWWFKSKVFMDYTTHQELKLQNKLREEDLHNESFSKKQRLNGSDISMGDDLSMYEQCEPLAEFCKVTQDQIMEVRNIRKAVENGFENYRSKSEMLEEMLTKALLDEA
ncbi:uncharacterized protein LOC107269801 [Cephus cinctus]|uniref:Germinal-center associated nuclear protein n=1 Tax=Cephus cinctus TaxID=211228 RepID=A0AAJ7C1E0_CEPCN|nr:uncharacterized protein LOC107269801 [Cephus cinctus]